MSDPGIQTTGGQHPLLHPGGLPQDDVETEDWIIVENSTPEEDVNYIRKEETCPPFCLQLKQMGLELKDIPGDGNCLFSALGDQIEGHIDGHLKHREDVVKYMMEHRSDFEPFLAVPFERHIMHIKQPDTHAGFDAIVAFARLHQVCIIIHRLNEPTSLVQGSQDPKAKQLHIACHDGDHYSSVRKAKDNTKSPANISIEVEKGQKNMVSKHNKNDQVRHVGERASRDNDSMLPKEHKNDQVKDGKVKVVTDTESLLVKEVREATGCEDEERILEALLDSSYDVDAAIAIILQEMETLPISGFSPHPPVYPSTVPSNLNTNQNQQEEMETIKKGSKQTGFLPSEHDGVDPMSLQGNMHDNKSSNQAQEDETVKNKKDSVQEMNAAPTNPICHRYLVNSCKKANCKFHHHDSIKLPYLWQIRMPNSWLTLDKLQMIKAEKAYCNIKASSCKIELYFEGNTYNAVLEFHTTDNFTAVVSDCGSSSLKTKASVRRLTTMSYAEGTKPNSKDSFKTQWRWFYTDNYGRWHLLEPEFLQFTLEQKFTSKSQDTYLLCRDNYQVNYRIDFRNMKQFNMQTGKERHLMRRPLFVSAEDVESKHYPKKIAIPTGVNATPLPTGWVPWDLAHAFELVELTQDSVEFKKVESSFFATLPTQPFQIAYIFRVQNMELWMAYEGQKKSMKVSLERAGQTKEVDERNLFHGTDSVDTVLGICTNNFDFRVCGKNGTLFGKGAYFAQDARYSHRFTNCNKSTAERYMFLAKVLVGEYTIGFPTYTRPPQKPGGKAHQLFDSCVDNIDNPSVFVVFDLKQCYPEYLICYKRLEEFPFEDDILVPPFQTFPPFWIPLVQTSPLQGQPTQAASGINTGSRSVGNKTVFTMPGPASASLFYSPPQPPQRPSNTSSSQIFYRRQDNGEDNIDMTSCSTGNSSKKTESCSMQ